MREREQKAKDVLSMNVKINEQPNLLLVGVEE